MRIHKQIVIVTILSLTVFIATILFILYWSADDMLLFHGGRGYVNENHELLWENGDFDNSYKGNDSWLYRAYIKFVLKSLDFDQTDDIVRDVQLVQFCFSSKGKTTYQISLGYDFYQQKVYAFVDHEIYQVKEPRLLKDIMTTQLDHSLTYTWDAWRGQSIYASEEFYNTDMSNPTFRYNLHWLPSERMSDKGLDLEYRKSGFINTTSISITSAEEAIQQAAKELGYQNPIGIALYDETCGYWMVELLDDKNYTGSAPADIQHQILDKIYTVIMDDRGRTLETYRHVTRYLPFLEAIRNKSS